MEADSFFARWSRQKAQAAQAAQREPLPAAPADAQPREQLPTLDDVARLTPEDDFTPYFARGVEESVRRGALKKLFADPRFNMMDGLDVYIGDYASPDPIPARMLAALNHAQELLDPLARLEQPLQRLLELPPAEPASIAKAAAPDPDLPPAAAPLPAPISTAASDVAQLPDTAHDDPI